MSKKTEEMKKEYEGLNEEKQRDLIVFDAVSGAKITWKQVIKKFEHKDDKKDALHHLASIMKDVFDIVVDVCLNTQPMAQWLAVISGSSNYDAKTRQKLLQDTLDMFALHEMILPVSASFVTY